MASGGAPTPVPAVMPVLIQSKPSVVATPAPKAQPVAAPAAPAAKVAAKSPKPDDKSVADAVAASKPAVPKAVDGAKPSSDTGVADAGAKKDGAPPAGTPSTSSAPPPAAGQPPASTAQVPVGAAGSSSTGAPSVQADASKPVVTAPPADAGKAVGNVPADTGTSAAPVPTAKPVLKPQIAMVHPGASPSGGAASGGKARAPGTADAPVSAPKRTAAIDIEPPAPRASGVYHGSLKDDVSLDLVKPEVTRRIGAWIEGYDDVERRSGVAIVGGTQGGLTSRKTTRGLLAGGDMTFNRPADAPGTLIVGLLGGYSHASTKYSSGTFTATAVNSRCTNTRSFISGRSPSNEEVDIIVPGFVDSNPSCCTIPSGSSTCSGTQPISGTPPTAQYSRTDAQDVATGGSAGVYAAYVLGKLSMDVMFKADFMSLTATDTDQQTCPSGSPVAGFPLSATRSTTVDFTNIVLASNAAYRMPLNDRLWMEPIVGLRYLHTSYGTQNGNADLGVRDGDALRVQGGLRFGTEFPVDTGTVGLTLSGLLYSDVYVHGFGTDPVANVQASDQGKLRALGLLTGTYTAGHGVTLYAQGEVRGGEDLVGYGGKAGFRFEW